MVGESPSAMALPHQQMLSDTPATMPRHPHSHMINELLQVLEQRLGETTAAMPQDDGHGEHMMGEPSVRIPLQYQQMMVDHPPVAYGFTDLDGDLGLHGLFLENEEHLPAGRQWRHWHAGTARGAFSRAAGTSVRATTIMPRLSCRPTGQEPQR